MVLKESLEEERRVPLESGHPPELHAGRRKE